MASLTIVTFEDVLAGKCGEGEAKAAQRWLDAGAPLYEPPGGLITVDRTGFDMRIDPDGHSQRRRRTSGHGLLASPGKPSERPAAVPAAGPVGALGQPAAASKRMAIPSSTQQPQKQATKAAAVPLGARPPAVPGRSEPAVAVPRRPLPPAAAAAAALNQAAAPAPRKPAVPAHSRPGVLQRADAAGFAVHTKGQGMGGEFQLPPGWQVQQAAPSPTAQQQQDGKPKLQHGQHGKAGKPAQQAAQPPQPAQQYVSPEGLVLPSLQAVREVLHGALVFPKNLVRFVKAAAADPAAAMAAAGTNKSLAHQLGLRRVRVVRIAEEREQRKRRIEAAAGGTPAGKAQPGGGVGGGGAAKPTPPPDRRLRRRS